MINEIVSAAGTSSGAVVFAMITIMVGISAIWAAVQAYKAWRTFRRLIDQGRSH